jgi:hypothetical protein
MPTKTEIKEFSELIELLVESLRTGYMDAIITHCENTGLELEVASTLLTPALKVKIREEAQEVNLIKKTSKLPI